MKQHKMLPVKLARLLAALREGVYSARELGDMSGLAYLTVLAYLRALHEARIIYVREWAKDALGRESVAIYELASVINADAPAPPPVPRTEQQRRYRARRAKHGRVRPLLEASDEQFQQAQSVAAAVLPNATSTVSMDFINQLLNNR